MAQWTRVADTSDLAPDQGRVVEAGGKTIALFNVEGTFYAIDNTCLHRGGPLGEGELEGTVVTCPWHGWRFDVATGACEMNPCVSLKTYGVRVRDGIVEVEV
jgi:NAD(P)H-dependent nitrite reductase small subunit